MLGKLAGWAKKVGDGTFQLHRFNIGPRLTLCFFFIILALLVGNAVSLWQFHLARTQADRLSGVDQELIAVLQAHTSLMLFYERLDVLAHSESAGKAGALQTSRYATAACSSHIAIGKAITSAGFTHRTGRAGACGSG